MIKNIWQMIEPYCDNGHTEDIKLEIAEGPFSLFYACPKYQEENRSTGERACSNRVNLVDYEKMIMYISDMLLDAEADGCQINLKNYKWVKGGIDYEIFEHTQDTIKVKIKARKSLK